MTPQHSDLAAAVTRLETQVGRLKLALGGIVLAVGAVGLTAWALPQEQTMTAERYLVLDADGIPRGNFGILADGSSIGMMFTDLAGNPRVEMRVDPDGLPRVAVLDDQSQPRAEFGVSADGTPSLILAAATEDTATSPRVALSVTGGGAGQLIFLGLDGTTRQAMIGTLDDGRPLILLSDASGEIVFQQPSVAAPPDTTR